MLKVVKPAYDDPENSVDLFDADRENESGGMYCVAASIFPCHISDCWNAYTKYEAYKYYKKGIPEGDEDMHRDLLKLFSGKKD